MSSKDAYRDRLEAQLNEWQAKIDVLKARAERAEADSRIAYREQIDALQKRREEMQSRLDELRRMGEDAWTEMKAGTESAWKDMEAAVSRALERFR